MKTRLLVIIGIIAILGTILIIYDQGTEEIQSQPDQLTKVLDYCKQKGTGVAMHQPGLSYSNGTHYIDNNTCEWKLLENYPDSDILCIPGQYVENNEHRIRNGTHIYNNEACMWEEIEICKGYCGGKENENIESERKILQCYGIFNCNISSQYFESCIGAKKNGVTIEQLCLDSDITIDNGCATIVFPDGTKTVSCHYEV